MPKYIFLYKEEEAVDVSAIPEEEVAKIMKAWGEWLGTMGKKVVDEGDTFKLSGKSVSKDGVQDADNLTSGYSIIEADSFDEALAFAKQNPGVKDGTKVEIYEAFGL